MSRPWELRTTPSENDRLAEGEAGRSVGAMQAAHSPRGAIVTPPAPGDALLLAACRGERTDGVPVWFMRQAGRSLPEYRAVRSRASLVEITHNAELAAEVTLQPVRRHGVDAAILFSDIVSPLEAIGVELETVPAFTQRQASDLPATRVRLDPASHSQQPGQLPRRQIIQSSPGDQEHVGHHVVGCRLAHPPARKRTHRPRMRSIKSLKSNPPIHSEVKSPASPRGLHPGVLRARTLAPGEGTRDGVERSSADAEVLRDSTSDAGFPAPEARPPERSLILPG
jgi:Uroporphyrinogen decarboxylase (URO-D)